MGDRDSRAEEDKEGAGKRKTGEELVVGKRREGRTQGKRRT